MNTASLETLRANLFAAARVMNTAPLGPAREAAASKWREAADALHAASPAIVRAPSYTGRRSDAIIALGGPVAKQSGGAYTGAPVTWIKKDP